MIWILLLAQKFDVMQRDMHCGTEIWSEGYPKGFGLSPRSKTGYKSYDSITTMSGTWKWGKRKSSLPFASGGRKWEKKLVTMYRLPKIVKKEPLTSYKTNLRTPVSSMFDVFSIDFAGRLPVSVEGNKFLLVCVKHLTGWTLRMATKNATIETSKLCGTEIKFSFWPPTHHCFR